jgi:hypothetical protein
MKPTSVTEFFMIEVPFEAILFVQGTIPLTKPRKVRLGSGLH